MGAQPTSRTPAPVRADRQERAFALCKVGHTYREISAIMKSEGYRQISHETVRRLVKAECDRIILPLAEEHVKRQYERLEAQLVRLEAQRVKAEEILARFHVTVSHGKIITLPNPNGEGADIPLRDDGPELQALSVLAGIEDRILKVGDSIRRLFGIDAPTNVKATVVQTTETDEKIKDLVAQVYANGTQPVPTEA